MNPSTHNLGGSTGVRGAGALDWKLLLSFICRRSIERIHPAEDVLLSDIFRPPCEQIGQA